MHLSPTIGTDIAEAPLNRHLQIAIGRVEANRAHRAREAARNRGVCIAGMDPAPFVEPTARDLIAAAEASLAREQEMKESPAWKAKVAATALRKMFAAAYQQAEALEAALSRADGSGTGKLNALAVTATDLQLACSNAFLTIYDAEHQGEVA